MTFLAHKSDQMLGQILTHQNLLTEQTLNEVLKDQERNKTLRLGDYLVENKIAKRDDIENALKRAGKDPQISDRARIGEVLIATGVMDKENVKQALINHEKAKSQKLGYLMVKNGVVAEDDLLPALSQNLNVPLVDLEKTPPSENAIKTLSKDLASNLGIVPVELRSRLRRKTLVVATTDPKDYVAEKYLSFKTGCAIKMVLASSKQISEFQKKAYNIDYQRPEAQKTRATETFISPQKVNKETSETKTVEVLDTAVIKLVYDLLQAAVAKEASFIHFESGVSGIKIRYRIDGECHLVDELSADFNNALISRLKLLANLDATERKKPQNGKISLDIDGQHVEFHVETTPIVDNLEDAVLRVVANVSPISLGQLGFSESNLKKFTNLLDKSAGLILCVGPAGSGKTTTIHSALEYLNAPNRKIWTVEEPVKINHTGIRQVQVNPHDGLTFSQVLRTFLRADPDVIMVGDMRDSDTAKMIINASLSGHLMFSTLQTKNAAETVNYLLETGLDPMHYADALLGILAQRLVRKLCDTCKQPYHPSPEEYQNLITDYGQVLALRDDLPTYSDKLVLMRKHGCSDCGETGYSGRLPIHELLLSSGQLKQLIINRQAMSGLRHLSIKDGMRPLRMDGILKVFAGLTDYEQVRKTCS